MRVATADVTWLVSAGALLAVSGACLAALMRVRGIVAFGLAVAVLAFAEIVVLSHGLSALHAYDRRGLLLSLAIVAAGAAAGAVIARPPWPSLPRRAVLRRLADDRLVLLLAAIVLAELVYLTALALFTPPVERDAISYHLVRALFWIQDGAIGRFDDAVDARLNEFPVNAELLQAASMLLTRSARWVGLVQLTSLLVGMLAIFGIARRVGLDHREAMFGALLFATLPVVALQAPTALNDLVVAALAATAAYFWLGRSASDIVLAAGTVALLVGTKVTALLTLPLLAALPIVAHKGRHRILMLSCGLAGVLVGCAWYATNVAAGTGLFGTIGKEQGGSGAEVYAYVARASRYLVETVELPGAAGNDRFLFVVAAALVAVGGALWKRRDSTTLVAAGLTLLALLVLPLEGLLRRVYWRAWDAAGYEEATVFGVSRDSTVASNVLSWYGPVGLAAAVTAIVLVSFGKVPRVEWKVTAVLAAAPVVAIAGVAFAVGYIDLNGRFVMGGVALSAATWGLILGRTRAVAIALVALAATTLLVSLVHYRERPSGIDLLEDTNSPSIWTLPREWAQSIEPEIAVLIGYADDHIPRGAPIAVARTASYPFAFAGYPAIDHRVVYADTLAEASSKNVDWVVLPDGAACEAGWRRVFRSSPWALYRQVPRASCR